MRLVPTQEEEREMEKAAGILKELSKKAHEKLGDLTRRRSVLLMELGRRKATGQPVEDLEAEMEEIDQKSKKLAALRNRARGAANEADEFWNMWLRAKRQPTGKSERAGKYDISTELLYSIVREVMEKEGGIIREDEEWWDYVLSLVNDEWVSRFSGSSGIWKAIEALRLAKDRLFPRGVPRVYTSREEAIGFGTSNVKAKLKEDVQSVIKLCNELETLLGGVRTKDNIGWIMKENVINDVRRIGEGMEQLLKKIEEGSADVSAVDLLFGEVPHALRERISEIVQYIEDEQTAKNLENKGQKLVQALTSLERLYRFYRTLVGVREGVGYPPHEDSKLEMIYATGWGLKSAVMDDIREVLDLMEELEALVKGVETSTENRFGQQVKDEFIAAVKKAKRAMTNAFNELVKEQGLVELSGQTKADFLRWTSRAPGGGVNIFTVGVSDLIHYSEVTDESLKQSLEKTGREISETLGRLELWYKNYRDTCRLYEEYKAKSEGRLAKSRLLKAEAEATRATILERIRLVERYWKDAAGLLWSKFRDDVNEITEALSEVKACVATEEFSLDALQKKVNKLCNIATKFINSEEVQKYINETLERVREEDLPARFAVGAWCVEEFKSQLEALCSEVQGSARTTEGASTAKFRLFKAEVY